jgi:hypothetical protein
VCEHALHFLHAVCRIDQAGVEIDRLAARHERVDRPIVEEHEIDRLGIESGGRDDRCGHITQQRLGFGVAQHRLGGSGGC